MKLFKFIPLVLLLVAASWQDTAAQKVAYMDSDKLLAQLPEMKAAAKQLETYTKKKDEQLQRKSESINKFYVETSKALQEGKLSPNEQQVKEAELKKRSEELQKERAQAEQDVMNEQARLFQPIIEKVNAAIKSVAEENDYSYVFDAKAGAIVHVADESDDIIELVKKKLGI